jgi:hypothetical protein
MTMLLAAALVPNPIGRDIVGSVFSSGQRLSRNIWQLICIDRACDPRNDAVVGMAACHAYLETSRKQRAKCLT